MTANLLIFNFRKTNQPNRKVKPMIQTQFAHTVTIPDEWEHNGHTFQVTHDEWAECPTEWLDSADALCVLGGPHGCILHRPAETDCPAMWEKLTW